MSLVRTSTKENKGMDEFEENIKEMFLTGEVSFNDEVYITNIRHKTAISDAYESLKKVLFSLK